MAGGGVLSETEGDRSSRRSAESRLGEAKRCRNRRGWRAVVPSVRRTTRTSSDVVIDEDGGRWSRV